MQQIYSHADEGLEVYTTVFSPRVCRSRTRRHVGSEKVVEAVARYQSRWPKELDLNQGDLIQVLFEDDTRWFGRLPNGEEGYFPAACVQACDWSRVTPPGRRGSAPADETASSAPCGCTSSPKLLKKSRMRWPLNGPSAVPDESAPPSHGSPGLLHRVLAKSRRKSCPLLYHRLDSGSFNIAFQPD